MEGQSVTINNEMGTPGTADASRPISPTGGPEFAGTNTSQEGFSKPDPDDPKPQDTSNPHPTEEPDRGTNLDQHADTDENAKNEPQPEVEVELSAAEEELSEEQITKDFDTLWKMLDDKAKKQFIKLLRNDKKEKQFSETSVAFLRAIKLMFAIVRLAMPLFEEPKYKFTGADLKLNKPPEGTGKKYLINGLPVDSDTSWSAFQKEVAEMKDPMDFSTFMIKVLEANDKCSNGITTAKQETGKKTKTEIELNLLQSFLDNKAIGGEYASTHQSMLKKLSKQLFGKFKKPAVRQPASVR